MPLESSILPPSPVLAPGEVRRAALRDWTWLAKRRPSGNTYATYAWARQGDLVHLWFMACADVEGSRVIGMNFGLPPELPHPGAFSVHMPCEITVGNGILSKSPIVTTDKWRKPARQAMVTLRRNSMGGFEIYLIAKPIPATYAWGSLLYYA